MTVTDARGWTVGLLAWAGCVAVAAASVMVREVEVRHRRGLAGDESLVRSYTGTQPGEPLDRVQLTEDVRLLQQSGRFAFVEAVLEEARDGVRVVFLVEPRLRLRQIEVVGADALGAQRVRQALDLSPGDPVDDAVLAARALKVREAYRQRHRPDTRVSWAFQPDDDELWTDVEIRVTEGPRVRVRAIEFEGNEAIRDRRLRGWMRQKRFGHPFGLTGSGRYEPDDLAGDAVRLREGYLNAGYLDARVEGPDIEPVRGGLRVRFHIEEGPLYLIETIRLEGAAVYPEAVLRARLNLASGQPAALETLRGAARALREWYGRHGYIEAVVRPEWRADPDRAQVDVVYRIEEGRQATVRDIRIQGHAQTQDRVIRRELALAPGDVFDETAVRVSERRLFHLGYFSHVGSRREPAPEPEAYDLVFEVEEQPTGQLMVGAGFSSVDAIVGYIEVGQGNFDLFGWPRPIGAGQKIKFRSQFGTKRTDLELSFVEPWLFNRRLALGVDFYRHDRRFLSEDYKQRNLGGHVSLTRGFGRFTRGMLRYALEDIEVYDVSPDATDLIRDWEGKRLKSAATLSLSWDRRDAVFVPTRGGRYAAEVSLAGGPFGGDTDLYRLDLNGSHFWPLWFGHVFNLRAGAAVVEEYGASEDVPIFDRLFLGGAYTVRGFRYRDVGPKDEVGRPVGGKSMAWATAEYSIPLFQHFRLAGFCDAGMVWPDAYQFDQDINAAAGVGLRIDIPMFPLRLDYAWPLRTDAFNDHPDGRFSFTLGYGY